MKFYCRKVRPSPSGYKDKDGQATPMRGWQALLVPVESQHEEPNGIIEVHIWTFKTCPYTEGAIVELSL